MASQETNNKKIVAGIFALLFGGFGIHKFYLGYTTAGILQIVLSLFCCLGGLIGIIEGIIYLTKSDEDFEQTYLIGRRNWF